MAKRDQYDAFISYRHCLPDSEIAERLQKKLESYRLPADVAKKVGRSRLGRVFRDETELAVSDDLSEVISSALKNSEFLIAVCSPEYRKSIWCRKEIEEFLRFNDRKHILLVLADGEPDTAFPESVMYEELYQMGPDGRPVKYRQYKEPLAADCKAENTRERHSKVDKAVVRLIATIFGLSYDDLQQRHKQALHKRRKKRLITAFSILGAVLAISVFFLVRIARQNAKISRQNEEIQAQKEEIQVQKDTIEQKYADSMAGISENLLRDGKRKDAVYAARSVLPDHADEGYSEASLEALSEALGIYEISDNVTSDETIQLPCAISDFIISPRGGYVAAFSLNYDTYVMEISTGKMLLMCSDQGFMDRAFDGERGFVFQREGEGYFYLDFSSGTETGLDIGDAKIYSDPLGNGYTAITDNEIMILRGPDILCRLDLSSELPTDTLKLRSDTYVYFSHEGDEAWIFVIDFDSGSTYAYSADLSGGGTQSRFVDQSGIYDIRSDGKSMLTFQNNSYSGSRMCLRDLETGTEKFFDSIDSVNGFNIFGEDVVLYDDSAIYILNSDLEVQKTIRSDVGISSTCYTTAEGIVIFDRGAGCYLIRDGECRFFDPDVQNNNMFWPRYFASDTLYLAVTGETQINTFVFKQADHLIPYSDTPAEFEVRGLSDNPVKNEFKSFILENENDFGPDMIYDVCFCENADFAALQLWNGAIYIYRRSSGERVKRIYETFDYSCSFYFDESSGNYYIDAHDGVEVFDKEFNTICSISRCFLIGYDAATGHPVVTGKNLNEEIMYLVMPVSYEELIKAADDLLSGYEPDQRIKEKYGLT